MALLKLRRHTYFLDCEGVTVTPVSAGRFTVTLTRPDRTFLVVGGRASGGAANEWFVYAPEVLGDTWHPMPSMIAAIRAGLYV